MSVAEADVFPAAVATPAPDSAVWCSGLRKRYGRRVAVDDVHRFKRAFGEALTAGPGQGWIVVRATELTPTAILSAIDRGDFYASSGVELSDYAVDSRGITITIKAVRDFKYRTQFIGADGKILSESISNPAIYKFRGNEKYVRARVIESNGAMAWTQPVFRKK